MDIIQKDERVSPDTLDKLAVAPNPAPDQARMDDDGARPAPPKIRTGHDATDVTKLQCDPTNQDAKLDVALDGTFPTSDAPAVTQPCRDEPAPSSGFDEEAEAARERERIKAQQ